MKPKDEYFHSLQVNFQQAPAGFLGIHAYKKGCGCVYFEVPNIWMEQPEFFERLHDRAVAEWEHHHRRSLIPSQCPVCFKGLDGFLFRYHGQIFCRGCGSHLAIDAGYHVSVVRKNK